jgi:integrase
VAVIIRSGAFKVMCQHIELKKNTWYYRRRIPTFAQKLYMKASTAKRPSQLYFSLKTDDKVVACKAADAETRRLDALWKSLQDRPDGTSSSVSLATLEANGLKPGDGIRHPEAPAISDFVDDLLGRYEPWEQPPKASPQDKLTVGILFGASIPRTLSDAKQKHFDLGKGPKGKVAERQFNRAWRCLIDITGDIPLEQIRREHANSFVSELLKTGITGQTIRKYIAQIRPLIQTAILEYELGLTNAFDRVTIPNLLSRPSKPRRTYSSCEIQVIQEKCIEVDDERRWAIAMLSDSMCRLSEIIGLRKDEVFLDSEVPHIILKPNEVRGLKTWTSERIVPLVGEALWAAKRAIHTKGIYLFPIFLKKWTGKDFSSGAASATLGKWLKENKLAKDGQSLHSFRHTMRDRLRNVETQADLIDRIGGWKSQGVGEAYGQGHSLLIMQRFMLKAVEALNGAEASLPTMPALD